MGTATDLEKKLQDSGLPPIPENADVDPMLGAFIDNDVIVPGYDEELVALNKPEPEPKPELEPEPEPDSEPKPELEPELELKAETKDKSIPLKAEEKPEPEAKPLKEEVKPETKADLSTSVTPNIQEAIQQAFEAERVREAGEQRKKQWASMTEDQKKDWYLAYHQRVVEQLGEDTPDAIHLYSERQSLQQLYLSALNAIGSIPEVKAAIETKELDMGSYKTFEDMLQGAVNKIAEKRMSKQTTTSANAPLNEKDIESRIEERAKEKAQMLYEEMLAKDRAMTKAPDLGTTKPAANLTDDDIERRFSEGDPSITLDMYDQVIKGRKQRVLEAVGI